MKRLMVLGSEKYFENLVLSAQKEGVYTIVCDGLKDTPAKKVADEAMEIDIHDIEKLINIALEKKIDGIVTGFTDTLIKPSTIIANRLNLPCGINIEQIASITNKKVMKSIFEKNDIDSPKYFIASPENKLEKLETLNFPLIVKPLDSSGSKGIYIVETLEQLNEKIKQASKYSTDNQVIVEEYYNADEIQGLGWVHDGKVHVMYIGDRELVSIHKGRPRKPKRLYYPSKYLYQYEECIKNLYQRIVDVFQIKNGPLYIQMLVGEYGVKVNEIMTRLPGGCDYLGIKDIVGYDIGKLMIDFSVGNNVDFEEIKKITLKNISHNLFVVPIYLRPGTVKSIEGLVELKQYSWVKEVFCNILEGSQVLGTGDMKQDCGRVFAVATNQFDARKKLEIIHKTLQIKDNKGINMIENFIR